MEDVKPHPGHENVTVTMNGESKVIHRGSYTVAELKQIFSIPLAEQFAEVVNGKIVDFSNDSRITIKGGEVFTSYTPTGTSA